MPLALAGRAGPPTSFRNLSHFQRLQEPFQRAFEQAAGMAAKVPPLEQEVAALRSAVEARDAEAERLRDRVDEFARGRDDDAAALEESQSRLAECEAALTEASARADEFAALLKSAERAHAASLAEFEAQKVCVTALTGERDALSATTAELQSGMEALRAALTETERRGSRHLSELASVRGRSFHCALDSKTPSGADERESRRGSAASRNRLAAHSSSTAARECREGRASFAPNHARTDLAAAAQGTLAKTYVATLWWILKASVATARMTPTTSEGTASDVAPILLQNRR